MTSKSALLLVVLCSVLCAGLSKSSGSGAPAAHKVPASRAECAKAVELCVTVPASWQRLGDIFDDLGFVVAEPHEGVDSALWPQLSVAAIDVPPQKPGSAPRSLDELVEIVLTPDGTFTSSETLQRTRLLINGADAEILRVRLHDDANKPEMIEEVALIEGDEEMVYSIALRCAPGDFDRLDPVFQRAAHSWRIKASAPPAPAKPQPGAEKKSK